MDEGSYVQFKKLKSKKETVKLTFYFFSCVVLPFCSLAMNGKLLHDFFLAGQQMEQMSLHGKEGTQHWGKLEFEGKWVKEIVDRYFCLNWVIF